LTGALLDRLTHHVQILENRAAIDWTSLNQSFSEPLLTVLIPSEPSLMP
jgi:hypothetical protein